MSKAPEAQRAAFAERLRAARERSGKRAADIAQDLGVHPNTVGNWLRASTDCPVGWVPDLAHALGVAVGDLIDPGSGTGIEPMSTTQVDAQDASFARRVIDVLERPLTAPDLMNLLAEARSRASDAD
jgi:transcriptional regulator with XRE-family HTH domain